MLTSALAPHEPAPTVPDISPAQSELDAEGATTADDAVANPSATATTGSDISLATLGAGAAGLDMTLQTTLARVIARMKNEFGRDVKVVEGVRSQQRQNQLFEQGRSTSGQVVTWTRNSHHAAGRAADVTIDGGYDDAAAFATLRRVAEEEGLHTLGAKDPGHLELRGAARAANAMAALGEAGQALDVNRSDTGATTARVAKAMIEPRQTTIVSAIGVARVASVAQVATVARVAGPNTSTPAHAIAAPSSGATANDGAKSDAGSNAGDGRNGDGRSKEPRGTILPPAGEGAYRALDTRVAAGSTDTPMTDARGDASSATAARTARVMDMQDAPGPRTLSRLTLSLDDGQGGQDQVRIGMRGRAIGASFEMHDANGADRLSSRLGELTRALEQRGLEPQTFQVRSAPATNDAHIGRVATQGIESQRAAADTSAPRHDTSSDRGGDAGHRNAQYDDQQERAQRRLAEQRRRGASFSLTSEES